VLSPTISSIRAPLFQRGHFYRVIEGTLSWSYDTKKAAA